MPAARSLDDPPAPRPRGSDLAAYQVTLRARRRPADVLRIPTELIESIAARLGVAISFDDIGYRAEFTIVAEDDIDADSTARRRWFYLASDLELPGWPITNVEVAPLSRTHAATW